MLRYVYMHLCFAQRPWVEYQSPYVGPHSNNVEILPITLNKEGFIKLLKEAWERHVTLTTEILS